MAQLMEGCVIFFVENSAKLDKNLHLCMILDVVCISISRSLRRYNM